jgi:hypothetical protein
MVLPSLGCASTPRFGGLVGVTLFREVVGEVVDHPSADVRFRFPQASGDKLVHERS